MGKVKFRILAGLLLAATLISMTPEVMERVDRALAGIVRPEPGAFALPRLIWNDDLSNLGQPDPALRAEDTRVRERVSSFDAGRLVVAIGATPEAALSTNEAVYARLRAEIEAGRLDGMRSLHDWLWPEALQRRNLAVLRASERLEERIDAAFQSAGFRPGTFAPFGAALAAASEPLTLAELRASPLGDLAGSLALDLGGRTGVITYLRGVRDAAAVEGALAGLEGVYWFEQRAFLDDDGRGRAAARHSGHRDAVRVHDPRARRRARRSLRRGVAVQGVPMADSRRLKAETQNEV